MLRLIMIKRNPYDVFRKNRKNNIRYKMIILECLNEVKFTDRTGDITLEKSDNEWKITDENQLIKLILNIDLANINLED